MARYFDPKRRRRRFESLRPRAVRLTGTTICFDSKINSMAHRDFMTVASKALELGYKDLTLDFSKANRAYPDGMLPIICGVEELRRLGCSFNVILPDEPDIKRLFQNANWAHLLAPHVFPASNATFDRHMIAQRFVTFQEQQEVVSGILDVAMRNMQLGRDVLDGLEWSLNEVTDNVLNHAQTVDGGLVQVTTFPGKNLVGFVVADTGRGILASMKEGFPNLASDKHAIGEAVKAGVTRNPDVGQGNGLAGTLRIATMSGGSFSLTSGQAQLLVQAESGKNKSQSFERTSLQRFPGTLVSAFVHQNATFKMADALAFPGHSYTRFDIIDAQYETADGAALILKLAGETAGFGTRGAGRQIRTKCLNLLGADPTKPLVLDWTGVPVISSSFADEFVGKLFVELGPIGFMSRIRSIGMEALVRGLVDKAILQRSAQASRQ